MRIAPFLLGLVLVFVSRPVAAAAMITPLATVLAKSPSVVIGEVREAAPDGRLVLHVEKSLRGNVGKGRRVVESSPDGTTRGSGRMVAFITADNELRWIGRLLAGPSIERGVLLLEGFFDLNAHIVTPGLITLTQLRHVLEGGRLEQSVEVELAFPDRQGGLAASAERFVLRRSGDHAKGGYAPFAATGHGWSCLSGEARALFDWGEFRVVLMRRCPVPTGGRGDSSPISRVWLGGEFLGASPDGERIYARAWLTDPALYAEDFPKFARDPGVLYVEREIDVVVAGARYRWVVDSHLVTPSGRTHSAGTVVVSSQSAPGGTLLSQKLEFGPFRLEVTGRPDSRDHSRGSYAWVQALDGRRIVECRLVERERERPCRLVRHRARFVRGPPT